VQSPEVTFTLGEVDTPEHNLNTTLDLVNRQERRSISSKSVVVCNRDRTCAGTAHCKNVSVTCPDGKTKRPLAVCLPECSSVGAACNDGMECAFSKPAETKNQLPARKGVGGQGGPARYKQVTIFNSYCKPKKVDPHKYPNLGCPP
jgi:hypothetical protein